MKHTSKCSENAYTICVCVGRGLLKKHSERMKGKNERVNTEDQQNVCDDECLIRNLKIKKGKKHHNLPVCLFSACG